MSLFRHSCAVLALASLTACPQKNNTTDAEIDVQNVFVSGAALGDKGRFRIELTGPASSAFDVTITSDVGVTFPASVQVAAGKSVLEGEFTPNAVGDWGVTFVAGTRQLQRTADVAPELRVYGSSNLRLQTNASTVGSIYVTFITPKDLVVNLTSSDAALVQVPATVTVPAFSQVGYYTMKAGATSGTARLTFTSGTTTAVSSVSVTNLVQLEAPSISPSRVLVGGILPNLNINFSGVPSSDITFTLTSSAPSVVTVPGTYVLRAGTSGVSIPLAVAGPGSATITVEGAGETRTTNPLVVLTSNSVRSLYCPSLDVNATGDCYLSLDAPVPADTQIAVTVDHPTVLRVPAMVSLSAGTDSVRFTVTGLTAGRARVTATIGTAARSSEIEVNGQMGGGLSSAYVSNNGEAPGTIARINIYLSSASTADRNVTITSSNPAVYAPQASAQFSAGNTSAEVAAPLLAVGATLVTLTLDGQTIQLVVESSNATSSYLSLGGGAFEVGSLMMLSVNLSAPVTVDTPITVTQSASMVLDIPLAPVIRAGQSSVQFAVRAARAGMGRLSASTNGQFYVSDYVVVATPTFTVNGPNVSVGTGGTVYVSYDCQLAADRVITLTQAGTGVLNMAPTVIVGTHSGSASTAVTGQVAGTLTLTATQGTEVKTDMVTVAP